MRRLVTLIAASCVFPALSASGFELSPGACAITESNGNAEIITQIAADNYGIERSDIPETTITFVFYNTTSADEGNPTPGTFELTIEPEGQGTNAQFPWRDGWSVIGNNFRLYNVPAMPADIAGFEFHAFTPDGEHMIDLLHGAFPQYYEDNIVMVQATEYSVSAGVEILDIIAAAPSFELRVIGHDGGVIAVTEFDSTEHTRIFDGFADKVAEVEALYADKATNADLDCTLEAPL